ncbi:fimbria/pilus outer membrane usher protein [Erwinia papayae]|uniref:Fimbria/pilus outer membrane usher protein n=1 Tax=Erwinia papayae TaxID=206499 RepID=A0ABV3N4T8_9GAMM
MNGIRKVNAGRATQCVWAFFVSTIAYNYAGHFAYASETFNPNFLQTSGGNNITTDLSVFENKSQPEGVYVVDIWLNGTFVETKPVNFHSRQDASRALPEPCLNVELLATYGVRTTAFPELINDDKGCTEITVIPQASATFNFNLQRLDLSIPQAAMQNSARGFVSSEQFDEGITALLLNYRFSGAQNKALSLSSRDNDSQYLNLRPGLNFGAWRLRNYSTWNRNSLSGGNGKWDSLYTYLQRNIVPLKAQLTLGESTSPAEIFEGVPFRGAQLASDDEMLPESLRGYAPVVKGTARTNAQVIIRQNGYIIYQSYVAPGAFEITDLYATGGSGDLYVTVKEADGSEQNLVVPYASLPVLVREGYLKYSLTTGQYRPYDNAVEKKAFSQATAIYGLPWNFTLYGGTQAAASYQSVAFGIGKNVGRFGAFSGDVINAWSTVKNAARTDGQSLRVRYSKNFYETGTNFAIAGYRYSTRDYYSLPELMDTWRSGVSSSLREQARNRTELTLNQNLGSAAGSVSVSLLREDYWRTERRMESISTSYNNSYKGISYGIGYSYSRNSQNATRTRSYERNQIFTFNISIPLDRWLSNSWVNYTVAHSKPGNTGHSIGLGGTALENNNLYWNVRQGYTTAGKGNSGSVDGGYRGTYGELTGGYSYDHDMRRLNYGVEGGMILHANGLTLSQAFGNTAALIKAPGAGGVQVTNQTGVKTDFRGYTVTPNLTPYRRANVMLDTTTLSSDVDLDLSTQSVVPTRGAIVRATFSAQIGGRAMMSLIYQGQPVPFGAVVKDAGEQNKQIYIVGDEGQVYLNSLRPSGVLQVQWGKSSDQQCRVNYLLPEKKSENGIQMLNGVCQ